MPAVSLEAGDVPVLAVTTVVSFAKFKSSGFTHWGQGARSSLELGPTINGIDEEGDPMATGIQFWTKDSSKACIGCAKLPAAELRSDLHTNDHIGDMGKAVKHGDYDLFLTGNSSKELSASIGVDQSDYEKNEYAQAAKANDMLIQALAKER